ncbi:MAG: EamA family transporter [Nitriliruptoraceae bacterium]
MVAIDMLRTRSGSALAERLSHRRRRAAPMTRVGLALAVVYLVWGSTYLAMDVALAVVPPMLLMAVRFAIAGAVLYVWSSHRANHRGQRPTAQQWRQAVITGSLLLVGGTGLVALAMTWLASSTAALLAATVPVWMALFGRLLFGDRLSVRATLGLTLGLIGVAGLVDASGGAGAPMLLALAGAAAWAAGSMRSRIVAAPSQPMVAASMEMLGAAAVFAIIGLVRGELAMIDVGAIDLRTTVAFGYLVTAGSIVAFTAYRWLLLHASPALVGTHAYVNPVVAVAIGWAVAGEIVTARMSLAALVVVAGTALVVTGRPHIPVPAQATSGVDAFAGVARVRRVRRIGQHMRHLPGTALRMGAVPVARGYRRLRRHRGLHVAGGPRWLDHRRIPEEST